MADVTATGTTGAAMRYENAVFINTTPTTTATYKFIGTGFTGLEDALNPVIDETTYISDVSATQTLTGYKPEWAFDAVVIKDNDTIEYLRGIGIAQATGSAAETDIVVFDLWDIDLADKIAPCKQYPVTVAIDTTSGGAGGEKLTLSGKLLGRGDPVSGYFDTDTNHFATTDVGLS